MLSGNVTKRIVLVDDDSRIHKSVNLILYKCRINGFTNPIDGLEYIHKQHEKIDLVLLDIMLRGKLNGLQVLERIKSISRKIYVIMLSGNTSQKTTYHALFHNADDFIAKPFSPETLINKVAS